MVGHDGGIITTNILWPFAHYYCEEVRYLAGENLSSTNGRKDIPWIRKWEPNLKYRLGFCEIIQDIIEEYK